VAGGTPKHGTLCAEILSVIRGQLPTGCCRVMTSDVKVRIELSDLSSVLRKAMEPVKL